MHNRVVSSIKAKRPPIFFLQTSDRLGSGGDRQWERVRYGRDPIRTFYSVPVAGRDKVLKEQLLDPGSEFGER